VGLGFELLFLSDGGAIMDGNGAWRQENSLLFVLLRVVRKTEAVRIIVSLPPRTAETVRFEQTQAVR
jgi:hypothetical protein